jgi:nickel/cobalt exporter
VAPSKRERSWRWWLLAPLAAVALAAPPASAHPLGNFSINHYAAISVGAAGVELRYVLDLAEIPTFQELHGTEVVTEAPHPTARAWANRKAAALMDGLATDLDGRRLVWRIEATDVTFPVGAGGLPTLRLDIRYRSALPEIGTAATLSYRDTNYAGRAGWKEIVATSAPGLVIVESTVPAIDRSRQLTDYPTDLLTSPPQDVESRLVLSREPRQPPTATTGSSLTAFPPAAAPAAPPASARSVRQASPRDRFTDLMTATAIEPGLVAIALVVAAGLGALHALEPGHGKTMVAAYLVGSRGTAWHAVLLGLIVTASHTAGVYALGLVTLYASRYIVPERIYPWLTVVSGLTIAVVGLSVFRRRYAAGPGHDHHHGPDHHHHHDHHHVSHDGRLTEGHRSNEHAHSHGASAQVSPRHLLALGVTGGIVPCPGALVVLLSALALGRVGLGLALIVAFSAGLAAVLIVTGLLVVWAGRAMARVQGTSALVTRWLPLTSAAVMTAIGLMIALQALRVS